jgi:tetratricopeptide (TPR) repeat protein
MVRTASLNVATMATGTDRWQSLVVGMGIVMVILGLRKGIIVQALRYADDLQPVARALPIESPWEPHLRAIDDALARKDLTQALHAWRAAHAAALVSRRWNGLLAVGDAYLKIGEAAKFRGGAESTARRSYVSALLLASRDQSVEGVLASAAAFRALGDRDSAEQALRLAMSLAPELRESGGRHRIHESAERTDRARSAQAVATLP